MSKTNFTLSTWQRLSKWPGGKWAFSKLLCWKAPYFASVKLRFAALRPGYCEVHIKKHRAVLNHLGTVHAIAMCNMAETSLRAIAELEPVPSFAGTAELPVTVNVLDTGGQTVFRAAITMRVSQKN